MNNSIDWLPVQNYIIQLEKEGMVTRTFRRLDSEKQRAIIFAILDEAAEQNPSDLNIKNVARRADVAVGSLYAYFTNRERMLNFAVEICIRNFVDVFREARSYFDSLSLREALRIYLSYGIEWSRDQAAFLRLFARAAYGGDKKLSGQLVTPIANAMFDLVKGLLTQAAQRGEIRPDVDIDAAARLVNALMIAVGDSKLIPYLNHYFLIHTDARSTEEMIEELIDFILHGIG